MKYSKCENKMDWSFEMRQYGTFVVLGKSSDGKRSKLDIAGIMSGREACPKQWCISERSDHRVRAWDRDTT